MRSFWLGLFVGGMVGAAATWVALEKPWEKADGDDEAEVAEPDAGAAKSKSAKKRRKRRRRKHAQGEQPPVDEIVELTAADRVMKWKGQAVRLPAKSVDFADGEGGRSLNQGEIDAGIASASSSVVSCIGRARGNAELSATITLKMLVGPGGRVMARRVHAPAYLQRNGLFSCVSNATKRMKFAAAGGHTVVTVPFDLR